MELEHDYPISITMVYAGELSWSRILKKIIQV